MHKLLTNICQITLLLLFNCSIYGYVVDGLKIHDPKLLQYAQQHMPKSGTLRMTPRGFIYVAVDDNYVMAILEQLRNSRYVMHHNFSNVGAHISVMYEEESQGKQIKEFGEQFRFTPLGFYSMVIDDREYFMLAIDAPELAKLRQKYGLTPKLYGHAFHITLGVRKYEDDGEDELAEAY